jgi:hypothetical protein
MYRMEKRISCDHKMPIHWSINAAYAGNANAHHTIGGGVWGMVYHKIIYWKWTFQKQKQPPQHITS